MELLDTISRVIMISSMIYMIIYFTKQGLACFDSDDDIIDQENEIYETTELMDYDEAVQWYIMQRDREEREVNFD